MEKLTLFGAGWCPNTLKAKVFLSEHNIPFEYVNVEVSEDVTKQIEEYLNEAPVVPTLLLDGKAIPNPDEQQLAKLLGINPGFRGKTLWC